MSSVIRCPKCGTTSATPGECDACHEGQVRYFCTNHEPGLWLEARTCPTCDAGRSEAARRPAATPPAVPVKRRSTAPARAPKSPPPYALPDRPRPVVTEVADEERWVVHERLHPEHEALVPDISAPLWQKLLRAALLARSMRLPAAPESDGPSLRRLGGCFMRLLLIGVVLVVGLVGAIYLFGRSLL